MPEKFVRKAKGAGDQGEEKLLRRIQSSGVSKASAIRIAKSRGMIAQEGAHLILTAKGRKARAKASE